LASYLGSVSSRESLQKFGDAPPLSRTCVTHSVPVAVSTEVKFAFRASPFGQSASVDPVVHDTG
jgi:hypothetical protein